MLYFFEDFVLDPDRRELRRENALIEAQPPVFDLLQYLIANRDRVVSMAISTQSGGHFTVSRPNPRVSHSRRCALAILRPAPTRISSVAHDANPVISIYDGRSPADVAGTFATAHALMMLGYMRSSTATGARAAIPCLTRWFDQGSLMAMVVYREATGER